MATNAARYFKLYVGNLPWTVGHNELKKYFSKFGPISQALVIFDRNTGLSKNYGFVSFTKRESYEAAANATSHSLEGNNLRVQPSSSGN